MILFLKVEKLNLATGLIGKYEVSDKYMKNIQVSGF